MMRLLTMWASLKLTLLGMLLLAATVLLSYRNETLSTSWVVLSLALLGINLLAALLMRPQFRRQPGLLIFHLCLLAIMGLAALGIMVQWQGRVEIAEGQPFDAANVSVVSRGAWHPWRLDRLNFVQGPIEVDYKPGLMRVGTRSEVSVENQYRLVIGDTQALALAGYRFVTTSNKGYAALLTWINQRGEAISGSVHMPSYPLLEWKQENQWLAPTGQTLRLALPLLKPEREQAWTLSSANSAQRLLVEDGEREIELKPGQSLSLPGGVLRFDGLRLWMGYRIDYNPTLPWLFAAAMVGIMGLAWHFWHKLGRLSVSRPLATAVGQEIGLERST